nr:LysR substrate-binding domain-containing protein [Acidisphaera sp. L21]
MIFAADLEKYTMILLDPINTPGLHLRRQFEDAGIRVRHLLETNLSFAALEMVRAGLGIYITDPVVLLSGLGEGLVVRPMTPSLPVTLVAIYARHRPVPRPAVRFMAHLRLAIRQSCETLRSIDCEASAV